jgi:deoxyribonuclease-4
VPVSARTTATRSVRIGSHVPVKGGLVKGAFPFATDIGATAIQVFVGNPRGWALSGGDPREDEEFGALCDGARIPVFVHTPYLVNLGSPTPTTAQRSVDAVAHNLARAQRIGARGVVVHTGSCVSNGGYDGASTTCLPTSMPSTGIQGWASASTPVTSSPPARHWTDAAA